MDAALDFQHAKMTFVSELDSYIRHYRSGVVKILQEEVEATKQYVAFMSACRQLDISRVEREKNKLKTIIGNMLYETLESGKFNREFSLVWTTTIHQSNMFYNKCCLLCEFMEGTINHEQYEEEETKERYELDVKIHNDIPLEMLVSP